MGERIGSLRVAMIINGYTPRVGGAERMLAAIAPLLQQQGVPVYVLTRRYPGLSRFEEIEGVPVTRLPIPGPKAVASLTFTLTALPLLRHLRPHIIHAHDLFSTTTTALLARAFLGVPVVVTPHGGGTRGELHRLKQKTLGKSRLRLFREQVNAFVTISRELAHQLENVGVPAERCHFIPNGVDARRFAPLPPAEKPGQRAALGLPSAPLALYAGRLSAEKRPANLVAAWPAVREKVPDALLLMLGSGPEEPALKQAAGDGVRFLGSVDDVVPYLQVADLFVLPSAAEGLSLALLEAQATGLPAVATNVGGNPDIITNGENGLLVPPDDHDSLSYAIIALLNNTEQRDAYGQRGRERVLRDFTLPIMADRLHRLYQEQAAQNRGGTRLQ
jgi:glycosyltransferase involved in cell wall biosynthesis